MKIISYIIMCLLQPVCWPFPEISTILIGQVLLGPHKAFLIGYVCILIGIIFMYKITFHLSEKYLKKFKEKDSFKKYQNYILKNEILATTVLFIIPVLPDEVICIGSAIIGIKFSLFLSIALFAKAVSVGMVAYSEVISNTFNVNQINVIIIEILFIYVVSILYKKFSNKL